MNKQTDGTGKDYYDIGNIRVTILKGKTFIGACSDIRIQAYTYEDNNKMHR